MKKIILQITIISLALVCYIFSQIGIDTNQSYISTVDTTEILQPTPITKSKQTILPYHPENSKLTVHYIDVGQADASLIVCGNSSMLIDGGNVSDSSLIVSCLKKQNILNLDYLICTHAHEDHVGGLSGALSVLNIKNIIAPQAESDTVAYQNFKNIVYKKNLTIKHPKHGEIFPLGDSNFQILGPIDENTDELNNTSIVIKLTHGKNDFLFAGDAEIEEELDIINVGYNIKADVLKLGHHGSDSSTCYMWLREINPTYAIISVGKDNVYGHPSETVLSRLRNADIKLYRTDLHGDITVMSDGNTINITTQKNEDIRTKETDTIFAENLYIRNNKSKKFHRYNCDTLPNTKNRVFFSNRNEALNAGYSPCGNCNP